jgi:hypothetical protein
VTHDPGSRIVSFDLMPKDPDWYFVLTEALREFAARQRAEASDTEDADDFGDRLRRAETAEAALDRIEGAMNTAATIEAAITVLGRRYPGTRPEILQQVLDELRFIARDWRRASGEASKDPMAVTQDELAEALRAYSALGMNPAGFAMAIFRDIRIARSAGVAGDG